MYKIIKILFIAMVTLNLACKKGLKTTVETKDGVTIKTHYTAEGTVEIMLITIGDSSFVAKPPAGTLGGDPVTMALSCTERCIGTYAPVIDIECYKKCIKHQKFQIAEFSIAE